MFDVNARKIKESHVPLKDSSFITRHRKLSETGKKQEKRATRPISLPGRVKGLPCAVLMHFLSIQEEKRLSMAECGGQRGLYGLLLEEPVVSRYVSSRRNPSCGERSLEMRLQAY